MNILFVTDSDVSPLCGGVERVVYNLSREFSQNYGINCFLAFYGDTLNSDDSFSKKLKLERDNEYNALKLFVFENDINIIVSNITKKNNLNLLSVLGAVRKEKSSLKHYFVFHNLPAFELVPFRFKFLIEQVRFGIHVRKNIFTLLQQVVLMLMGRNLAYKILRKKYLLAYENTDKVILLDGSYISLYALCAGVERTDDKFEVMPNALSFPDLLNSDALDCKKKQVLIVARLDEKQKRISFALDVWHKIEEKGTFTDWKLLILGAGDDEDFYKKEAQHLNLSQVQFCGRQNPVPYYKDASIFMMTSAFEGFPMVLIEAQQMGVVPIAFNSFGAVSAVIENNRNGMVVENNDIDKYAQCLINLMADRDKRKSMAMNGLEDCKRFEMNAIVPQWIKMFDNGIK